MISKEMATPQVNYTINPVLTTAAGEQQVVFAGFFDDDAAPTKYYMMHDFHSGRTDVNISHIDLTTDTVVATEDFITTTTSGSVWAVGTNFSGCYCPYNGSINL